MAQSTEMLEAINQTVSELGEERSYTPEQQEKLIEILKVRTQKTDEVRKQKLPKEEQSPLLSAIQKEHSAQISELLGVKTEARVIFGKLTENYRALKKK